MNKTYLCFDLGTTKIKSSLLNSDGKVLYLYSRETKSYRDGLSVIQKPEEYYNVVQKEIKNIARKHENELWNVDSIICSGQMAGILGIDNDWQVVFPWTYSVDTRANIYLDEIEKEYGAIIRKYSGGVPFMAAKIK